MRPWSYLEAYKQSLLYIILMQWPLVWSYSKSVANDLRFRKSSWNTDGCNLTSKCDLHLRWPFWTMPATCPLKRMNILTKVISKPFQKFRSCRDYDLFTAGKSKMVWLDSPTSVVISHFFYQELDQVGHLSRETNIKGERYWNAFLWFLSFC